jgi:two-component system chemotaxis response regulator CheB
MPESALAGVDVDYCLPASQIGVLLNELAGRSAPEAAAIPADLLLEARLSAQAVEGAAPRVVGQAVPMGCPECGGPLRKTEAAGTLHYRCHVGHSYSAESLEISQNEAAERALWVALRTLEERAAMLTLLAQRAGETERIARHYETRAAESRRHAQVIRTLLLEKSR